MFVVHPGIDEPARSSDEARRRRRAALGISPSQHVVGLVARFEPGKRHELFLDVMAVLVDRALPVHGLVVGGALPGKPSQTLDELETEVRRRGLDADVTLTGQVADACVLIELMDVVLSLAPAEAFGIAVLEAMALGVPVIASATGGPREIIEDGESGLLVAGSRAGHVADAVQRVLEDVRLRERLSAAGVERFRSRFAAERMTADLQGAIAELGAA